jgi:solute carrier family 25 phosphate transporter 23/24/25/41
MLGLLGCGALSSLFGQLASYPLALIRTRMQAQNTKRTMSQEIKMLYQLGGLRSFYAGILPNFVKVAPTVGISYVIYEHMRAFLGLAS